MRKVLLYSLLLVLGLIASQFLRGRGGAVVAPLTAVALAFIMIHVGYEFEIDKSRPRQYAWDYFVAATAASLPWLLCALWFAFAMAPIELWSHPDLWREAMLEGLFASPTSAGVLFSMLAAAGLGATWLFKKARVLAIFDDLNTILLLIPLKAMMIGLKWQLIVIALITLGLLWLAWRYLDRLRWRITWPWVFSYAIGIVLISEAVYIGTRQFDPAEPIHVEVLLPAFALGCMLRTPQGQDPHRDDATEGCEPGPEARREQRVSTIVSACFMVLVGLSMPPIVASAGDQVEVHPALRYEGVAPELLEQTRAFPGWGVIALHVVMVTLLSNIGKMFPAFVYKREAPFRHRLALAIGMFPRGEVGAGVLVIALSYGLAGPALTVAVLSLALNLLLTGAFIVVVKKLIAGRRAAAHGTHNSQATTHKQAPNGQ
jgi:Kef-type K+ transport system membrane component KefB